MRSALAVVILLTACSPSPPPVPELKGLSLRLKQRLMPRRPSAPPLLARAPHPEAGPSAPQPFMDYHNGPLLQSANVTAVQWGAGVTLPSGTNLNGFFGAMTGSSPYISQLSEYNAGGYAVGSAGYTGTVNALDARIPASSTLDERYIHAQTERMIDDGTVTSASNSIYFYFLPPGLKVSTYFGNSCQDWCGYHESFTRNGAPVFYAIIPDYSSDCASICGGQPEHDLYFTSSHELGEAITDADVGDGNYAWYDPVNNEIGDICGEVGGTVGSGVYPVQALWSNSTHGCRDHAGSGADTIDVTPAEQSITSGSSATFTVTLAGTAGSANLSGYALVGPYLAPEMPMFAPASISPGGSSTMTLTIASTVASDDYPVIVQVTDASGVTHLAQPTVHVTGSAPTITNVSPATGPSQGGTTVTLTGTNFGYGATVTLGGVTVEGGTMDSTHIQITTPSHAAGGASFVVTNANDAAHPATSPSFSYTAGAAPTVTKVRPVSGPTNVNQQVTITGTNFSSNATVSLGGSALPAGWFTVLDANTISIYTPSHAAGKVNVTVTNADGLSGTLTNGYDYGPNAPPVIDELSDVMGPDTGGTYVSILGSDFDANATVTFGGTPALVKSFASDVLGVVSPAHSPGAVDVIVSNADAQNGTSPMKFTYVSTVPADMAAPLDMTPSPDLSPAGDLATAHDLAASVDLAQAPDLSPPPGDFAQPADLAHAGDLASAQDLAGVDLAAADLAGGGSPDLAMAGADLSGSGGGGDAGSTSSSSGCSCDVGGRTSGSPALLSFVLIFAFALRTRVRKSGGAPPAV